jgi:CheY-like chemotaxis protein
LLVASQYDAYTLEEGGRLTELLLSEYRELNLSYPPHVARAASGDEAIKLLEAHRYDMVVTMTRLGDMSAAELACRIRERVAEVPIYTLAFSPRELQHLQESDSRGCIDRCFLWNGDVRLLLAIIKCCEDERNVAHDTRYGDVRCILLIEDSVRFYSSYLPLLYNEVLEQTQSLMAEGINLSHRLLRLRARPKILLATTFEEAWELYSRYKDSLLGVIADGRFPWQGVAREDAGLEFIRRVKYVDPHTPTVLQSTNADLAAVAHQVGAGFIQKRSRTLLQELRNFMLDNFGFGEFVFRLADGTEVGRAADLKTLVRLLRTVPGESVQHHASHDHFSNWLRARTEFQLAAAIRPRKVTDFEHVEELREFLVQTITRFRSESQRGVVADFSRRHFDTLSAFVRIGGGSLGGKGRGLAFVNSILHGYGIHDRFPGTIIRVPTTAVIGTDVFDSFLDQGNLRERVLTDLDDEAIVEACLAHKLPPEIYGDLEAFLDQVRYPLAVRSSSLLEDSQFQPFAGVYATYMLANNHPDLKVRLDQLCDAIKLVYASTYTRAAKSYVDATANRIEEEKMAVIVQQVVGRRHGHYDYPHFSGVGLSANFYPAGDLKPEDGVVTVALGLGRTVVGGGKALRFSPARPLALPQFGTVNDWLHESQREFFAVDVSRPEQYPGPRDDFNLALLDLAAAEAHGTLAPVGSVYVAADNMIYDGLERDGERLLSFAGVLKSDAFPLAEIMKLLLDLGRRTMSAEVEIEFAVVLSDGQDVPHQFGFLQIRPLAAGLEAPAVPPELLAAPHALVATNVALGNGRPADIRDVLYVPRAGFDRARTREVADEIAGFNRRFVAGDRPYLLVGPGRWGSSDRWLGIPVRWDEISGARVIVEADLDGFAVTPSQGSHFFQNLTCFQVGYLTVNDSTGSGRLDWDWLDAQPAAAVGRFVRHLRLAAPLTVLIDGRSRRGIVLRPEAAEAAVPGDDTGAGRVPEID